MGINIAQSLPPTREGPWLNFAKASHYLRFVPCWRLRWRRQANLPTPAQRSPRLFPRGTMRRSRRRVIGKHGGHLAMRYMMRRALQTGGEPVEWRWLRRAAKPRPIVLVADISGSTERYSRFLMRFGHGLARSGAPVGRVTMGWAGSRSR